MTITEILEELPKLSIAELDAVQQKLDEVHGASVEETPELLAAVDEGIRSANEEPLMSLEDLRKEMSTWTIESK